MMSNNIGEKRVKAQELYDIAKSKGDEGDFANKLAALSFESHLAELREIEKTSEVSSTVELLDFRIIAPTLEAGTAPLDLAVKLITEIRKTLSFAALRLVKGGMDKKRITKDLSQELDLRLKGLLPGSTRFIVSAASNRDLLDDGISKLAIERMFAVLCSLGKGEGFLSSINALGPSSAKSLREFLKVIKSHSATAEFTWSYMGDKVTVWEGSKDALDSLTSALETIKIIEQPNALLRGKIELLSKRERIELRVEDGSLVKILFPKSQLSQVSELRLDEEVSLYCQVVETENPITDEASLFYELLEVRS